MCDYAAPRAASLIARRLRELNDAGMFEVLGPYYGDVNRFKHDLNRRPARNVPFRMELQSLITRKINVEKKEVGVLDIHSYDAHAPWVDDAISRGVMPPQVVFMDSDTQRNRDETEETEDGDIYTEYSHRPGRVPEKMMRMMNLSSGFVGICRSPVNDIVKQAKELGAEKSLLIEFHEDYMTGSTKKVTSLIDLIVKSYMSLFL